MSSERAWWRSPLSTVAAGALLSLVLAELVLGRLRGAPADFTQFLGRFHPLVVHLPIGIFVLVVLAEGATFLPRLRGRIDPALSLVLPVMVLTAVAAFVLGHLLARSGEFPVRALMLHRRLAFLAAAGSALSLGAWAYQGEVGAAKARWIYRGLLFGSVGLLSLGAHFGGTMTRGETYLSKYAPSLLKPLLGGETPTPRPTSKATLASAEPLLFGQVVQPIFDKHCIECHGTEKVKGGLRLDSLENLKRGGESGPALVPGVSVESALVKRMHLPVEDDERMPPKNKPAPSPAEIALIAFWIDRGAGTELRVRDALAPEDSRAVLEAALKGASERSPKPARVTVR